MNEEQWEELKEIIEYRSGVKDFESWLHYYISDTPSVTIKKFLEEVQKRIGEVNG